MNKINNNEFPFTTFSGFDKFSDEYSSLFWEKGRPFYLKNGNQTDTVVICLHGFTASPYEAYPIAEECFKLKMDAVGPLFEGHGYSQIPIQKKAIRKINMERILESTRKEIKTARKTYKNVYIYGQSMGGSIALIMAGEGLVDACATTAPAIKLPFGTGIATTLLGWLNLNMKKNPNNGFFNLSYKFDNSIAGKQIQKLALHARKMLYSIDCPVLTVHSHNDKTIDTIVTKWIEDRSTGETKTLWFNESGHTMPLDKQGKEVSLAIAKYFETLRN